MCDLLLGVRLNPADKMKVIKLSDIDLKDKVKQFRKDTAKKIDLATDSFDLIYCGCTLENESSLESCGLKNGSMVHILKRKDSCEDNASNPEPNIDTLASVFKSFIGSPLLELALRRLTKRPEVIENIISSSPGLNKDAVAIAILQDPDLIVHFTDNETIKKIAKQHPALLEAAQHIASAVHEEAHNFAASSSSLNSSSLANTTGHSYSLENLSEDEEMAGDSSQSSDSAQPSSSNRSRPAISAAHLLAAITRARRSTNTNNSDPVTSSSSPSSQANSNGGGRITFEMFNQAMQQAFALTSGTNDASHSTPSTPNSNPPTTSQSTTPSNDMQRQITIMHEMGLNNDAINLQALQITNGDVNAAIDLVLNGLGDN